MELGLLKRLEGYPCNIKVVSDTVKAQPFNMTCHTNGNNLAHCVKVADTVDVNLYCQAVVLCLNELVK